MSRTFEREISRAASRPCGICPRRLVYDTLEICILCKRQSVRFVFFALWLRGLFKWRQHDTLQICFGRAVICSFWLFTLWLCGRLNRDNMKGHTRKHRQPQNWTYGRLGVWFSSISHTNTKNETWNMEQRETFDKKWSCRRNVDSSALKNLPKAYCRAILDFYDYCTGSTA